MSPGGAEAGGAVDRVGQPDAAAEALSFPRRQGRLRALRHALLLVLVAATGWAWFGVTGSVPVLIWWWRQRPTGAGACWQVEPGALRAARLGPWRTRLELRRGRAIEIFHDEVDAADLARLRRMVKVQLAAG